jgi:hypothetical protein
LKIQSFSAQTQRIAAEKPELLTTILTNLEADPAYIKANGVGKNRMITDAISDAKTTSAGAGDTTLRTKALDVTSKYFAAGGPGYTEYRKLQKTDPVAAQKMYNDYFNQQLGLAKSTLGAAPTGNVVDFNSLG